jgi:hypothetical protein
MGDIPEYEYGIRGMFIRGLADKFRGRRFSVYVGHDDEFHDHSKNIDID